MGKQDISTNEFMGDRLLHLRKQANMTQQHLGELLGVTRQQVDKYERGLNAIGHDMLAKVCGIFYVARSHFMPDDGDLALILAAPPRAAYGMASATPQEQLQDLLKAQFGMSKADRAAVEKLVAELSEKPLEKPLKPAKKAK